MFHIGNYYTLRCGCYEQISQAQNRLQKYKKRYKDAYVTQTRRSRFEVKKPITAFEYKYDFNASAVSLFPKISNAVLKSKNSLESSIKQYTKLLQREEQSINKGSDFFGLSVDAKYDQYFSQDYINRDYTDYEYNLKIKYDIFKNGYYQHKKEKEILLEKNKISTYQDLINLQKFNLEENLANLDTLQSAIDKEYYKALYKIYKNALKRSNRLFKDGVISKERISSLSHKKEKYLALEHIYKNSKELSINKKIYLLLYKIDSLNLKAKENLTKLANKNNSDFAIQNARKKLAKESKKFSDDIILNVYASHRAVDEVGDYKTIGTELNIPLNFSAHEEEELNKIKISALNLQKQTATKHICFTIDNLYKNFKRTKALIKIEKLDIKNLDNELQEYKTIANYYIAELNIDYEDKILRLQEDILKDKYEIMSQRVEALTIILKLASITNIYDFNNLLED
jgi:hypothetical protein